MKDGWCGRVRAYLAPLVFCVCTGGCFCLVRGLARRCIFVSCTLFFGLLFLIDCFVLFLIVIFLQFSFFVCIFCLLFGNQRFVVETGSKPQFVCFSLVLSLGFMLVCIRCRIYF